MLALTRSLAGQQIRTVDLRRDMYIPQPPATFRVPTESKSDSLVAVSPDSKLFRAQKREQRGVLRTVVTSLESDIDLNTPVSVIDLNKPVSFEVKIENAGDQVLHLPIGQRATDLQPEDSSLQFGYWELIVGLDASLRGVWGPLVKVHLFGSDDIPGTMVDLKPGEWLCVLANGWIHFVKGTTREDVDLIHAVNGSTTLSYIWVVPGMIGSGFTSRVASPRGPDWPVRIIRRR